MDLIDPIIHNLPILTADDLINADDSCPICLVPFSSILSDPESGVTKLDACNHIFCRKEYVSYFCLAYSHVDVMSDMVSLTQWVRSWVRPPLCHDFLAKPSLQHGSCPTCRHVFLDIRPPSESDDESSDGGEYVPHEHDDDFDDFDDDAFIATDEFSDAAEFEVEEMELDRSNEWDNEDQDVDEDGLEWAATDGDFPPVSEGVDDDTWNEYCEHE
jgi:hypothetical protein